jgi:signal transduction histidine kinase
VLASGTPIQVDGETVGWLLAARADFRQSQAEGLFLDRINRTLAASAVGAVAVSLILGALLARTLTRPIRELTAATHAVAGGLLDQKVPVRSRDELGDLANSFNRMSSDLSRSQKARRQMTADIAHELRTPISVILGHVDALEDGVIPSTSEAFGVIRDEADRLSRLVEDLRLLSHAEAGEMTLMRAPVEPRSLLDRAAAAHRPLAAEKGIELRIDLAEDLPEIDVDADRMAQVLDNLVSNALRHTPEGGQVRLYARRAEDGIVLGVHDSGPGIEPEALPLIFDRFYRLDSSRRRDTGGSGLGLAIARSLVEAHGGSICAQSGPGEGADFVIHLRTTSTS